MNNPEFARQRGVFISKEGEFHTHPHAGDHEIRPKKKKEPKSRGPKPFDEVMEYVKEQRLRLEDAQTRTEETLDGGLRIVQDGMVSLVGEAEYDGRPVKVEYAPVSRKKFTDLSEKAQKLYWGLHHAGKI